MKRFYLIIIAAVLVISFLVIAILSPDANTYKERFSSENYEKIGEIPVQTNQPVTISSIIDNLPVYVDIENGKTDKIEIWVSKTISTAKREYIKQHLELDPAIISDSSIRSLSVFLKGKFVVFKGEDWIVSRAEGPYKELFGTDTPLFRVLLPERISYEKKVHPVAAE